jgi:hypothetical protein
MRRADLGQMMAVTFCLNPYLGQRLGMPSIIEISVRKLEIRLISEVLVNIVSEHTIIQIKKFIVFKY